MVNAFTPVRFLGFKFPVNNLHDIYKLLSHLIEASGLVTVQSGVITIPGLHWFKPQHYPTLATILESQSVRHNRISWLKWKHRCPLDVQVPIGKSDKSGQGTVVAEDEASFWFSTFICCFQL